MGHGRAGDFGERRKFNIRCYCVKNPGKELFMKGSEVYGGNGLEDKQTKIR